MHKDLCNGRPGLCDAMKPTKGTELLKYLRKVNFEGECIFLYVRIKIWSVMDQRRVVKGKRLEKALSYHFICSYLCISTFSASFIFSMFLNNFNLLQMFHNLRGNKTCK